MLPNLKYRTERRPIIPRRLGPTTADGDAVRVLMTERFRSFCIGGAAKTLKSLPELFFSCFSSYAMTLALQAGESRARCSLRASKYAALARRDAVAELLYVDSAEYLPRAPAD
jgi:hypothetical protein